MARSGFFAAGRPPAGNHRSVAENTTVAGSAQPAVSSHTSGNPILQGVDNVEISVDGDVLVAEDGGNMQIVAITPSGVILPVIELWGHGGSEITGPAFDPSLRRLYFSSQTNGQTFEVTDPFVV